MGYGLASSVTYEAKNNGRSHRKFDATRRNRYAFDSSRCEIRINIHQTNLIVLQECMALDLDLSLLALLSTPNMNLSAFVILVLPLNHLVSHHSFTILKKTGARQQRIPSWLPEHVPEKTGPQHHTVSLLGLRTFLVLSSVLFHRLCHTVVWLLGLSLFSTLTSPCLLLRLILYLCSLTLARSVQRLSAILSQIYRYETVQLSPGLQHVKLFEHRIALQRRHGRSMQKLNASHPLPYQRHSSSKSIHRIRLRLSRQACLLLRCLLISSTTLFQA